MSSLELNGVARMENNQLYLDFPNREPMGANSRQNLSSAYDWINRASHSF